MTILTADSSVKCAREEATLGAACVARSGSKVLAGTLEPGDFYRKVQGRYVYLVLDPDALARGRDWVYGAAFHGGISYISKDTRVVRCGPDEFLANFSNYPK